MVHGGIVGKKLIEYVGKVSVEENQTLNVSINNGTLSLCSIVGSIGFVLQGTHLFLGLYVLPNFVLGPVQCMNLVCSSLHWGQTQIMSLLSDFGDAMIYLHSLHPLFYPILDSRNLLPFDMLPMSRAFG